MRTSWLLAALLASIPMVAGLTGCGGPSSSPTESGGGTRGVAPAAKTTNSPSTSASTPAPWMRPIRYAIVPKMLNNPVFTMAKIGAEQAAQDIEAEGGPKIEIIYQGPQTGDDPTEQARILETLTNRGVDGIALSVINPDAVRDRIADAKEKGIPVVTFDSDCPNSKRIACYAVNDEALGAELANQLIQAVGGEANMEGEIAILSGQSSAPNLQARVKGVMSVLQRFQDRVKVLPTLFCDDRVDLAIRQIGTTMNGHPNLRGWILVGGWPLFGKHALDSIKDLQRTKVVSVDALPDQWPYLENGQVCCLVAQRPFAWGHESVHMLNAVRRQELVSGSSIRQLALTPRKLTSPYDLVFKDPTPRQRASPKPPGGKVYSVVEYRKQWAKWLAPTK